MVFDSEFNLGAPVNLGKVVTRVTRGDRNIVTVEGFFEWITLRSITPSELRIWGVVGGRVSTGWI